MTLKNHPFSVSCHLTSVRSVILDLKGGKNSCLMDFLHLFFI